MENVNEKIESLKKHKKLFIAGFALMLLAIPIFFNDLNTYLICILLLSAIFYYNYMLSNNSKFYIKHFIVAIILTVLMFIPTILIAAAREGKIERSNRLAEIEKINAKYAENAKNVEKLLENYLVKNDPDYVSNLCKSTKKELLQKNILQKCAESHAILVDKSLTENKTGEARVFYNLSSQEYGSDDLVKKYESRLTKAEKIHKEKKIAQEKQKERENKKIESEIKKQVRKEYAKVIRTYYLDSGLDIKVNVSG